MDKFRSSSELGQKTCGLSELFAFQYAEDEIVDRVLFWHQPGTNRIEKPQTLETSLKHLDYMK